jgi:hypothetical protein
MVVEEADSGDEIGAIPLSRVSSAVWHSLKTIETADGATCSKWKESCGVSHVSFYRARKLLLDRGLVLKTEGRYRTTPGTGVP